MEESVTYQAIVAEGMKKLLRLQGCKRFGPPAPATDAAFEAIFNPRKLEKMSVRIDEISSWEELLATVRNKRGNRKRKQST